MSSLRRLAPPLHLLRAFSAVTRFGSVSRAAEALHLTQSAVSKQIKELHQRKNYDVRQIVQLLKQNGIKTTQKEVKVLLEK